MISYLFLVAVVNFALGLGLAWQMGRLARARMAVVGSYATLSAVELPLPAVEVPLAAPTFPAPAAGALLLRLDQAVLVYQDELATLDGQLRDCLEEPQVESVSSCLDSMSEANQKYRDARREIQTELAACGPEQIAAEMLRQESLVTVDQQVDRAQQLVEGFDLSGDLRAGCETLLEQTERLQAASKELQGDLNQTLLAAGLEPAAPARAESGQSLSAAVEIWRRSQAARPVALALVNVDALAALNERYARDCCDRVLQNLTDWLGEVCPGGSRVIRDGGAFALLLPDCTLADARRLVERIRQTVERTQFACAGQEIRLTLSIGLAQADPQRDSAALFAAVAGALAAAKRQGGNRSFEQELDSPTPVAPLSLGVAERHVSV